VSRLPAVPLLLLALAFAGCGDDDGGGGGEDEAQAPPRTEAQAGECKDVQAPQPRRDGGERKPTARLDSAKTYDVTFETSCGDFTIRLAVKTSPATTASFYSLARKGFFDDTAFHRIVPGFVVQGGDPTGSGSGGPGYSTRDEPPAATTYAKGSVAMAKTSEEPPGTAGSQFYVVTGDATQLPPEYAVLGRVVKGLDVAERIDRLGDPASGEAGTPLRPVVIEGTKVDVS
jgi:peptidyl-prolyl cis-trans isomerase B (cyclophilin B)